MARWITQTLTLGPRAQIIIEGKFVIIGGAADDAGRMECGCFMPETREDANTMALALRLASKRLEEIGKGLS